MAQIKNKNKYPLITPKDKDYIVATQESTGKTRSILVRDLMTKFQEDVDIKQAPIKEIKLGEQELNIENFEVVIPNQLSNYENDMGYESSEGFTPTEYDKIIKVKI